MFIDESYTLYFDAVVNRSAQYLIGSFGQCAVLLLQKLEYRLPYHRSILFLIHWGTALKRVPICIIARALLHLQMQVGPSIGMGTG
jgi:hypothetical protein